jgi:serine/threonine protein kinase
MSEAEANPNMPEKCPNCGAPLPSGVLAGLCPACLLKQGAAQDTNVPPETTPFQPPSIEEVARMFPQLEILDFIGKGGMGAVYKARQPALDRIVALKILPPQTAGGPGFIERFNREARALARLTHPNIVTVHEFGQVNGLPFFIMEFVDGLNLRQLERAGQLSPREALQIVPQICEALQFAHDEGIVHRDIKPENILVDKKGRVKIADFGIAKILGATQDVSLTETKGAIGTPHYMAPEQLEKPTTVDHRADIFSLGVVFYEMLTGELPLGKFAPPSSRKVEVDVRLDDVVLRALEKDPERRYQQIRQVKTAVDTIGSTAAPPPSATG